MTCCPTHKTVADFSMKPLQSLVFRQQRNVILGLREEDFSMCKAWHKKVMQNYELWDDLENDLERIRWICKKEVLFFRH